MMLARLMEAQIWYQPTGSVGGGFNKGTMASAGPVLSFSLYTTGAFQVLTWCWSSEGASLSS